MENEDKKCLDKNIKDSSFYDSNIEEEKLKNLSIETKSKNSPYFYGSGSV